MTEDDPLLPGEDDDGEEMDNAAELGNIQARMRRNRRNAVADASFWKACLSEPRGRRAMWAMLQAAGTFHGPRVGETRSGAPVDALTWYYLGQKDYGIAIWEALMRIDPASVVLMHSEADERAKKAARKAAKERENAT